MSQNIEINPGEIKINFTSPTTGVTTFAQLGLKDEDLVFEGGNLRIVFDLENIGKHAYYHVPTVEIAYREEMGETHWVCDFNEETIIDKLDHHGHSTVILMNGKKLASLEHHHKNALVVHGDFPKPAHVLAEKSYINFFK